MGQPHGFEVQDQEHTNFYPKQNLFGLKQEARA
jgi:hypothetical protein